MVPTAHPGPFEIAPKDKNVLKKRKKKLGLSGFYVTIRSIKRPMVYRDAK